MSYSSLIIIIGYVVIEIGLSFPVCLCHFLLLLGVSVIHWEAPVITVYSLIGVSIAKLDVINIMNIICVSELKFCTQTLNIGGKLECFYGVLLMFP